MRNGKNLFKPLSIIVVNDVSEYYIILGCELAILRTSNCNIVVLLDNDFSLLDTTILSTFY